MRTVNTLIGSPIERFEDLRFLRGRGEYVDDLAREGLLHAAILRSSVVPNSRGKAMAQDIMKLVESREARTDIPNFAPGDTVKVHVKVKEGDKERIQIFQGLVISRKGGGTRQMFTVRKVSGGVGVERMFPLYSPSIDRIEVERHGRVRRAKLYYLRDLRGKAARIEEKREG